MKRLILSAVILLCASGARADSIFTQAWEALTVNTGSLAGDTDWVDIPYAAFDLTTKKVGWGDAALHYATKNIWGGLRYENLNGYNSTAGVQGQLQVTKAIGPFTITPFLESSIGIGKSSLYGNTGPGILINAHEWNWKWSGLSWSAGLGGVVDFEHYVLNSTHNGNKIDAGLSINVTFP